MNSFESLLYGRSPQLQEVTRAAGLVACTDVTVLITGESGTGKELLARAIHQESPRHNGPFVCVNCGSLSQDLAESTLFGHRKGSFTTALRDHEGHVGAAEGGTLFLDEVGELGAGIQAKLLRFLESGESQALGAAQPRTANVRIIAATNRNLAREVAGGSFREDLFYRLNVIPLEMPPLRARSGDIDLLLEHFTAELAERHCLAVPVYTTATAELVRRYAWPGNVRELRNFCERMVVLFAGRTTAPENLPAELRGQGAARARAGFRLPAGGIRLDELEQDLIRQALERTAGNRTRAARLLGLTRDTLLYRLKKYAIQA